MTNIIKLESINSTNTYCHDLLCDQNRIREDLRVDNVTLPLAVIAAEQYDGRGRYGKSFFSPLGSGIYLSYAFEDNYKPDALQQLTVVAAAVVHQVLQKYCADQLGIKWINDIYRDGRKVAGILTERIDDAKFPDRHYVVLGVGVNVFPCDVPEQLEGIIGFLKNSGSEPSLLEDICRELIEALETVFVKEKDENFSVLINYYRSHCYNMPSD